MEQASDDAAAHAVERRAALRAPEPARGRAPKRTRKAEPQPDATHHFSIVLEDGPWAAAKFGVTAEGTFEHGTSVLTRYTDPGTGPGEDPADARRFDDIRQRLRAVRDRRPQPEPLRESARPPE